MAMICMNCSHRWSRWSWKIRPWRFMGYEVCGGNNIATSYCLWFLGTRDYSMSYAWDQWCATFVTQDHARNVSIPLGFSQSAISFDEDLANAPNGKILYQIRGEGPYELKIWCMEAFWCDMLPMVELTLCLDPALWTPFAYLLISVGLNLVRHSEYHLLDPKCTSRIQIVCNTVWTTKS